MNNHYQKTPVLRYPGRYRTRWIAFCIILTAATFGAIFTILYLLHTTAMQEQAELSYEAGVKAERMSLAQPVDNAAVYCALKNQRRVK